MLPQLAVDNRVGEGIRSLNKVTVTPYHTRSPHSQAKKMLTALQKSVLTLSRHTLTLHVSGNKRMCSVTLLGTDTDLAQPVYPCTVPLTFVKTAIRLVSS